MRSVRSFWTGFGKIKYLSPKDPGPFVIRRLTKVEYGNTLHDLFGVDPAVVQELPDEVFGEGYLNSLSPMQSEQYLGIANEVLDQIMAPNDSPPTEMQKLFFSDPPASGTDLRAAARKVARSIAQDAYRRSSLGGGSGCPGGGIRSGARKQTCLPGCSGLDAQGDPCFPTVPLYYPG